MFGNHFSRRSGTILKNAGWSLGTIGKGNSHVRLGRCPLKLGCSSQEGNYLETNKIYRFIIDWTFTDGKTISSDPWSNILCLWIYVCPTCTSHIDWGGIPHPLEMHFLGYKKMTVNGRKEGKLSFPDLSKVNIYWDPTLFASSHHSWLKNKLYCNQEGLLFHKTFLGIPYPYKLEPGWNVCAYWK